MKQAYLVCLLLFASCVTAQEIQEHVNVNVVNVYVSAQDEHGHFVKDLKAEDFILKERGVAQTTTHFSNFALEKSNKLGEKDVPLTAAFVIDTSESMAQDVGGKEKIDIVKNAALLLID